MRPRRDPASGDIDLAELATRARWGGILLPPLTADERQQWEAYRRSQSDWHPQHALHYAWHYVPPLHGRRDWSLTRFLGALAADCREIDE